MEFVHGKTSALAGKVANITVRHMVEQCTCKRSGPTWAGLNLGAPVYTHRSCLLNTVAALTSRHQKLDNFVDRNFLNRQLKPCVQYVHSKMIRKFRSRWDDSPVWSVENMFSNLPSRKYRAIVRGYE